MTSSSSSPSSNSNLIGSIMMSAQHRNRHHRMIRNHRIHHNHTNSSTASHSPTVLRPIMNITNTNSSDDVDYNNNTTPSLLINNNTSNDSNNTSDNLLNRVAILKAFGPQSPLSINNNPLLCNPPQHKKLSKKSKYEKPTTARRIRSSKQSSKRIIYDPDVEQEFVRLRDSVPSIAGQNNVSDLTIINEAISLICDLESQLIQKLRCQSPSSALSSSSIPVDIREKLFN